MSEKASGPAVYPMKASPIYASLFRFPRLRYFPFKRVDRVMCSEDVAAATNRQTSDVLQQRQLQLPSSTNAEKAGDRFLSGYSHAAYITLHDPLPLEMLFLPTKRFRYIIKTSANGKKSAARLLPGSNPFLVLSWRLKRDNERSRRPYHFQFKTKFAMHQVLFERFGTRRQKFKWRCHLVWSNPSRRSKK
jgi:hypothetical protein